MAIRLAAEWMNATDERLLEYLDSEGSAPPFIIEKDDRIRYSRNYINKRLLLMKRIGLVDMIGNGVYKITSEGRGYLAGQVDLRDEPEPE